MVLNWVLTPLKVFWKYSGENQNGLGQKLAKIGHCGVVFRTKTWYFEWKSNFLRLKSQKRFLMGSWNLLVLKVFWNTLGKPKWFGSEICQSGPLLRNCISLRKDTESYSNYCVLEWNTIPNSFKEGGRGNLKFKGWVEEK